MAVSGEDVEAAIQIVVEKKETKLKQLLAGGTDACLDGFIGKNEGIALSDIEGIHFVGEIADGDAESVVVAETGGINAHGAAGQAVGIVGDAGASADFFESSVVFIMKKEILDRIVRHDQIDPAIVIHIHGGDGERLGHGQAGSRIFDLH